MGTKAAVRIKTKVSRGIENSEAKKVSNAGKRFKRTNLRRSNRTLGSQSRISDKKRQGIKERNYGVL